MHKVLGKIVGGYSSGCYESNKQVVTNWLGLFHTVLENEGMTIHAVAP
jgi:hypothetical protein